MSQPEWWGRVIERMEAYQRARPANLPGAAFGVETLQDGRLISSVGSWKTDAICSIGSMTKAFIATAVLMALEENDQLDIERPVHELPGMELYKHDEVKRRIRVRHLLQHTSGLPGTQPNAAHNGGECVGPGDGLYLGPSAPWVGDPGGSNECVEVEGKQVPARAVSLDHVSQYVMRRFSPVHEPGAEYTYSTSNYVVAARIVEQISGKSVNIYLKEKLFDELGMNDSFFIAQATGDQEVDRWMEEGVTQSQRERVAEVKLITQDGKLPPEIASGPDGRWDKFRKGWRFVYPDGGMYSTVEDLLKYLAMLRDRGVSEGKRILSEEIVKLMVEDQGFGHTMGLGYRQDTSPYGQGAGTLEHLGNMMTYMWYEPAPENPLLGVFLSQRLTNVAVRTNMVAGIRVIYTVFILQVESGVRGFQVSKSA